MTTRTVLNPTLPNCRWRIAILRTSDPLETPEGVGTFSPDVTDPDDLWRYAQDVTDRSQTRLCYPDALVTL